MAADAGAARRARSDRPAPARDSRTTPRSAAVRPPAAPDNLVHHRLRLGIVSALAAADRLTFNELKGVLQTTDGNLSVHARKLEDAGYVTCTKGFDGRRPRTDYRLTALGRKELSRYLTHMEALIRATRDTLAR
jgi:DNA-binding HxlR family transcriptional regulator